MTMRVLQLDLSFDKVGASAAYNYSCNLGSLPKVPIMAGWPEIVRNTVCWHFYMTDGGNRTPDLLIPSLIPIHSSIKIEANTPFTYMNYTEVELHFTITCIWINANRKKTHVFVFLVILLHRLVYQNFVM